MKKYSQKQHEVHFILTIFIVIGMIFIISKIIDLYQMDRMHKIGSDIYKHPLEVSNAALTIQAKIYKMDQEIRNILVLKNAQEIDQEIATIDQDEQEIYANLHIIHREILGKKGLELQQKLLHLIKEWKPIRHEVIDKIRHNYPKKEIALSHKGVVQHTVKLENATLDIYHYARKKAIGFHSQADMASTESERISVSVGAVILLLLVAIAYQTITRIRKDMVKNEHLTNLLSMIRDVNQLIVREKNRQGMIQECCNILVSSQIYDKARIILLDGNQQIGSLAATDDLQQLTHFQERIKTGWMPDCILNAMNGNHDINVIDNTQLECNTCPLMDLYGGNSALTLALKHNQKIYGYLTLAVQKKYRMDNDEITLLYEVAGDIAYALYNLQVEEALVINEERLRYALGATIDGIWDWDMQNGKVYLSARWKELLGYSDDELDSTLEVWESRIHPDERDAILHDVENAINSDEQKYYAVYRLKHKKGNWIWIETRAQIIRDEHSKALRMVGSDTDITDKKEHEDNLLSLKELYKNTIDSVENLLFVKDTDFNYITCNKAFQNFIGKSKEDIIGKSDYDLVEKESGDFFREHDIKVFSEKKSYANFEWVTGYDGTKIYLYTIKSPLMDSEGNLIGLVGNSIDLTEQKKMQESLKEAKKRYEITEKIGKVGSWEYILDSRKYWGSAEAREIYSLPHDSEFFPAELIEGCIPERKRVHQALVDLLEKGLEYKLEFEIHPYDGTPPKFLSSIAEIERNDEGDPVKVIGFIQDITELKQKDELMIMQSRHAAMGEMIGMIAHQWRQPISGISMDANNMLMDIALGEFNNEKAEEYAGNILFQTGHLSKTIDDFRNFFKPDKSVSSVKLKDIIEETLVIVNDSLTHNNIAVTAEYQSYSEVKAYPRELMQVFVNIFTNAKDALVLSRRENGLIGIKIYDDEEYVNTEISDNATGIDESILPKLFDPYFTTKDEKSGTGLGLYMSKMIIEEHLNGMIEAYNKDNGACFRVRLPLLKSAEA